MNLKKTLLTLLFVIIATYIIGVFFFSSYFMPKTYARNYLQQYDISFEKEDVLEEIITKNNDAQFSVSLPDDTKYEFSLKDFRNDDTHQNDVHEIIKSQNTILWPIEMWRSKYITYDDLYDVDETKLINLVESFSLPDGESSENAYIDYQDDSFVVMPEKYGTEIDENALYQQVVEKLKNNVQDIQIDNNIYLQPEIKWNDSIIKNKLNNLNKIANRSITIDLVDEEETFTVSDFIDNKFLLESGELRINDNAIDNFVTQLAEQYDTYNTKRLFTTHKGNQIYVGAENDGTVDTYGFSLNKEETVKKIKEALSDSQIVHIDAVWDMQGNMRDEYGDIGNTYVEISIDEQHLWYFVDGELFLDTPIVTGLATQSRHTPKGVYGIYSKAREINLVGEMDGESWDSFVNYWMSITWNEIGIHDAPWRYSFGGNIYQYDGSHGCINLPYEAERLLYENTEMNTCVIVY